MSGESFCSLLIVAFSLRNDRSKSNGSPFVCCVLLNSLLETKETNLKGFSCFLRIVAFSFSSNSHKSRGVPLFSNKSLGILCFLCIVAFSLRYDNDKS